MPTTKERRIARVEEKYVQRQNNKKEQKEGELGESWRATRIENDDGEVERNRKCLIE